MPLPRIAIIGAGPVGLTLARILAVSGIPSTIFELDASPEARRQGGIVDVHGDSGQIALKEALLFDEFHQNTMKGADALKVMTADGTVLWDENTQTQSEDKNKSAENRDKPEIDRGVLRKILLDSLSEEKGLGITRIEWGRKLEEVVESKGDSTSGNDNGVIQYDLRFAGGQVESGFDLVVGADGAWSKVRPLVTSVRPHYSGCTLMHLIAHNVSTAHPWLDTFGGAGTMFMFDEGRSVVCQRNADDRMTVYGVVQQPEDWVSTCGIDWSKPKSGLREFADRYFGEDSGCHADFRRVLAEEALDELVPRPLYMLPIDHRWEHRPGVTLVGDSAHVKTPFAGLGVNDGLSDALDLARALINRKDAMVAADTVESGRMLSEAVLEYERGMFPRSEARAQQTWGAMGLCMGKDAARNYIKKLGY